MPIGVVVSLFRALIATPSSCIVLSGVDGCASLKVAVSGVETHVTLPEPAVEVVVVVLVHTILKVGVAVTVVTLILVFRDSATYQRREEERERERREREREREGERERLLILQSLVQIKFNLYIGRRLY